MKFDLRKRMKSQLASLSDQEYEDLCLKLSSNLAELLSRLSVIQKHSVIGAFAPILREPKWFLSLGEPLLKLTAYPAYADETMIYKKADLAELEIKKDFGVEILGPKDSAPTVTPDLIIVPGLAFSQDGMRLGRGKGFYDRYLEKKSVIKIGVAFEMQMTKDVPMDPHDVHMDYVVTDHSIYITRKDKES